MLLVNELPAEDKSMISSWIQMYAVSNRDYNSYPRSEVDLPHVLREWDINKQVYLWRMLGEKFIIEREVSYQRPDALLEQQLSDELQKTTMGTFKNSLFDAMERMFNYFDEEHRCVRRLFEIDNLKTNRYNGRSCRIEKDDLKIDIVHGIKPMKVFNRLAKYFHLEEEFEAFRIAHSQVLNQQTLTGTLCLSIHPFDYMTMSDNTYGWDSCMNWEHDGCYRAGTVEMMNSPFVLVAYLRGTEAMRVDDYMWPGNKKWRELMVVHPHCVTNIKGYPYCNPILSKMALDWLRELIAQNLGWDMLYDTKEYVPSCTFTYMDGRDYCYDFETFRMYNDFGTHHTQHMIIIPQGWQFETPPDGYYNEYHDISGRNVCMCCGTIWEPYEGHEDKVMCYDCDPGPRCSCCGEPLDEDDYYTVGDDTLCCHCYEESASYCSIDECYYYNDDMVDIYLTALDDDVRYPWLLRHISVHEKYINTFDSYARDLFPRLAGFRSQEIDGQTIYYVNRDDCTSYTVDDLFGLWGAWTREHYVSSYKAHCLGDT